MDETGVAISRLAARKFLTHRNDLRRDRGTGSNRTQVTAIECISADGRCLDPLIIWPTSTLRSDWTTHPTPGWHFACSPSGYNNRDIALEWFRHVFDPQTKPRANGRLRVLINNGFTAHESLEVLEFCHENNIILCRLPSHTSHKLQPCDVAVFGPLKTAYRERVEVHQQFRIIVGSIVTLAEPLSVTSLVALLNMPQDTIVLRLRPLHSVLRIPPDLGAPIRTLHLSFSDFLLSDKLQGKPFGVNGLHTHQMLLMRCLELLSGPDGLRENLCDLQYPGQPRQEVHPSLIDQRLSPAFQYACRYWVHHVQHSKVQIHDDDEVHVFLQKHFLHWLEALSLINRLTEVVGHVGLLQSLVSVSKLLEQFLGRGLALM